MHSMKDSKKLKGILLAIDICLLAAAVAACAFCGYYAWLRQQVPQMDFKASMVALQEREDRINADIAAMEETIEQREEEGDQALSEAQAKLSEAQVLLDAATAERDAAKQLLEDLSVPERIQARIEAVRTEYGQTIRQLEDKITAGESDYKICYLTFDDGPTYQTDKFLDKLTELDVYATFFTIGGGITNENNHYIRDNALRREAKLGHTIANHTFTHAYYGPLYVSVDSFMEAVRQQDELVYSVTGLHTDIVRFPSGSHYCRYREETIQALTDEGYMWMDWIANAYDAGGHGYTSQHISANVVWQVKQDKISVVLMHDWNLETLGALDSIVERLRADNYLFLPLFKESCTNNTIEPRWG